VAPVSNRSKKDARLVVLLLTIGLAFLPAASSAQGTSHGYVSLGAGATDLNGGFDWVIADGPIGLGAEAGAGWVFLGEISGSCHLVAGRQYDVFAKAGYAGLSSSEFSSQGVTLGGGAAYWPATHVGIRFDALRFLPASTRHNVPVDERSPSRYWGVRVGVAFRFR
jgi:hypothetical protein